MPLKHLVPFDKPCHAVIKGQGRRHARMLLQGLVMYINGSMKEEARAAAAALPESPPAEDTPEQAQRREHLAAALQVLPTSNPAKFMNESEMLNSMTFHQWIHSQ